MNLKQIKELIDVLDNSSLTEIDINDKEFDLSVDGKKLSGYKYNTLKGDDKSYTVIAYYPKGDFTIVISLSSTGESLSTDDIKNLIMVH